MFQPPQVNIRLVEQISAGIIPNSQRLNLVLHNYSNLQLCNVLVILHPV